MCKEENTDSMIQAMQESQRKATEKEPRRTLKNKYATKLETSEDLREIFLQGKELEGGVAGSYVD